MYRDGDSCFLPLQTVSDFFFSVSCNTNITYNGQAIFLATANAFVQNQELTDLGEVYYDAPKRERSKALCDFGYNELCLALDTLYGLKQEHMIHSFGELFWQIALEDQLKDPDPTAADEALDFFIQYYLDDLHSEFKSTSPMAEPKAVENVYGRANEKLYHDFPIYSNLRSAAFPDGVPDYQEVGNTAYITFDEFTFADAGDDYYTAESDEELPNDTISLIIRAHRYITRENSPIENVVLDLTNNAGGSVDAAVFILGWLMGEAPLSIHYSATDAMATTLTRADVNLDRKFDKDDVLSNQKIFVLTSPVSFSCGNLLPCVLGSTDRAALVGRATAGGACMVQPLSTAWGSIFTISGPYRLSFLKNGSFYNVDQGMEPDYYVENLANLYNREALTKYLNDLF